MTWVINGVSVCCSLGWTLNHEISFLLLYLLFLISQLSYLSLYLEQAVKFDCLRCKSSGEVQKFGFPIQVRKAFFYYFSVWLCRSAGCGYIWLGLCQATVWCTVAITHSVSTCCTWKVSLMHKRYYCYCSIFKLLQRWTHG